MSDKHKFRAWDESQKYMAYQGSPDLETIQSFMYHFGDKELMQSTLLDDKNWNEIWEGDLREINGKLYKVVNDGWRFRFERNLVEFGENHDIVLDEDMGYISILKGNIFENPELINQPIKQDGNNNK